MKKAIAVIGCITLLAISFGSHAAGPEPSVEWTMRGDIPLQATPLDVSSSTDGKWAFVLVSGDVLMYSLADNRLVAHIPVDKGFDRITHSPNADTLILTNGATKAIRLIQVDMVYAMDMSGLPFMGSKDAPVVIADFFDYQCSYCAKLEPFLDDLLKKYPGELKIVHKNFPLRSHRFARQAAAAALAADRQGKFLELHAALFENMKELSDEKIIEIAKGLGLDTEKLSRDMKDPIIQGIIDRDTQEGNRAEVRGTPTIFVNGKRLKVRSSEAFYEVIERELKKKQAGGS